MDSTNHDMSVPRGGVTDADASQRSRVRDSLFLTAQLRLGDEAAREVRVRNLSEGGLMIELDVAVEAGTPVRLELRGIGEIGGKVAWSTQGRLGIALDAAIDPKKARKPVGVGKPVPIYATSAVPVRTPWR